jgi:hypothetical protein
VNSGRHDKVQSMRDLLLLVIHLRISIAKLLGPGSGRAIAAESLLLKQQLIVRNRGVDWRTHR